MLNLLLEEPKAISKFANTVCAFSPICTILLAIIHGIFLYMFVQP